MKLLLSPHNDDETLFCAYTIQNNPGIKVIIVFDSYVQVARGHKSCTAIARRYESLAALDELGVHHEDVHFLGLHDDTDYLPIDVTDEVGHISGLFQRPVECIYAPLFESYGHRQHNLVSIAARNLCAFNFAGAGLLLYSTYTRKIDGKTTTGTEVKPTGLMVFNKLKAMTHYKTQITIDELGCWPHFQRDQREYLTEGSA